MSQDSYLLSKVFGVFCKKKKKKLHQVPYLLPWKYNCTVHSELPLPGKGNYKRTGVIPNAPKLQDPNKI